MPISTARYCTAMIIFCLFFAGCSPAPTAAIPAATPTADPGEANQTARMDVPMMVEVTRIVTQVITESVIIEATPTPPRPCAQTHFEDTGEITIGSLLPLSGPSAHNTGFAMQTALNLAIDQLQRSGILNALLPTPGPLRLITYDTAGGAERAAEFAQRLITLDCAAVLIGGYHSHVAHATAEVAEQYGVPYLVLHAASDDLTATRSRTLFRLSPAFSMYARMPIELISQLNLARQEPIRDAIIIADPATISSALSLRIVEEFSSLNIEGEILLVDLPTQDFSPTIARILSRPRLPHAVFIYISGESARQLQSQLLQAGIGPDRDVQIISSPAARDAEAFWREIPAGVGTIVNHYGPWPGNLTPQGQEFVDLYNNYSPEWPPSFVFAAYDAVFLFANAAARADSLQGIHLIDALLATDLQLAAGHYTFLYGPHNPPPLPSTAPYVWQQWLDIPLFYLRYTEANQTFANMQLIWDSSHFNLELSRP